MRRTAFIMAMPVSIDIPLAASEAPFEAAFARLRVIDEQYSTFKHQSEVSKFRRSELAVAQLSAELRAVMATCEQYQARTQGYFSVYYRGEFDPTGYVKGWAIEQAADVLHAHGLHTFLINIAGDVFAASDAEEQWRIGLQNPSMAQAFGVLQLQNGAVATSGIYEQGAHIVDPHTGNAPQGLLSASVCGPSIATADVLATACVAMGAERALPFMEEQPNYELCCIAKDGQPYATPGMRRRLLAA